MNNANPLVSAIIPVYNCELYLREALESVLSQTYSPIEIIVIDDGSTDGSGLVAQSFGKLVRYVRQSNGGIGAARNRGVEMARGDFLAFLDADDLWMKYKLELQMNALSDHMDMVFGRVIQFVSPELSDDERKKLNCPVEPSAGRHPGAMLIGRESFFRVGLFETGWQVGEFIDWYAKAMDARLKSCMLSDVVLRRRLHGRNTTILKKAEQSDYLRVLKASLDRRRAIDVEEKRLSMALSAETSPQGPDCEPEISSPFAKDDTP